MTARIDRLWPDPADQVHDDELMDAVDHDGVRLNFVSSIDGAATRDGLSGGLGGPADKRYFDLLRRVADVVVVGAGTVRAEGYGPMVVRNPRRGQPVFAIVTGRLDLDPASTVFTKAPVRPVIITTERATGKAAFAEVADVVVAGSSRVDAALAVEALHARGLRRILCEGGPSLFGSFLAADAVDELCITVSPTLEAGNAPRIATGDAPPRGMRLATTLRSGDTLLLRYARARSGSES
ncbi:MAG: dihydrofolate reductase family protein [Pseudolysinimonas sp.]